MAQKQLLCKHCCKALGSENYTASSGFIEFKDRGKLFKATPSDIKISEEAEKSFERMLTAIGGSLPHSKGIADTITVSFFGALDLTTMFRELDNHMFESVVDKNHVLGLIKIIAKYYCKVRLYHLGNETTENLSGKKIRKKLSKLVLFNHQ